MITTLTQPPSPFPTTPRMIAPWRWAQGSLESGQAAQALNALAQAGNRTLRVPDAHWPQGSMPYPLACGSDRVWLWGDGSAVVERARRLLPWVGFLSQAPHAQPVGESAAHMARLAPDWDGVLATHASHLALGDVAAPWCAIAPMPVDPRLQEALDGVLRLHLAPALERAPGYPIGTPVLNCSVASGCVGPTGALLPIEIDLGGQEYAQLIKVVAALDLDDWVARFAEALWQEARAQGYAHTLIAQQPSTEHENRERRRRGLRRVHISSHTYTRAEITGQSAHMRLRGQALAQHLGLAPL